MPTRVVPNTKPNRLLARGVRANNAEQVRAALAAGASPNTYVEAHWQHVAAMAAWHSQRQAGKGEPDADNQAIISALVDAGVNLLDAHKTQGGRAHTSALHQGVVREHAVLGPLLARQLEAAGGQGWVGTDLAASWLGALTGTGPAEDRLRDILRTHHPDVLGKKDWWEAAMTSYSNALVDYCHSHDMAVPVAFVREKLANNTTQMRMGDVPAGRWVALQDEKSRPALLLGDGTTPGLLVEVERKLEERLAGALWDQALACPATRQAMLGGERAGAWAVLAMRQEPRVGMAFLEQAKAAGVDLADVRADAALTSFPGAFQAPGRTSGGLAVTHKTTPPEKASLLETHLRRPHPDVTVGLCRGLVRAGVKPTFNDLCALVARMTYETTEKRLTALFREWVKAGVDPDPGGQRPAWEHARQDGGVGPRLEAWYRAWHLEQALPQQARARAPGARVRI